MSYEMNGIRLNPAGGNALPRNGERSDRSDNFRVVETAPSAAVDRIREAQMDNQSMASLAERAAQELASAKTLFRPELEFKVDDVSGRTVITVYHPETEEIIRQIPPEEALRLAQMLRELGSEGDLSDISLIQTRA